MSRTRGAPKSFRWQVLEALLLTLVGAVMIVVFCLWGGLSNLGWFGAGIILSAWVAVADHWFGVERDSGVN